MKNITQLLIVLCATAIFSAHAETVTVQDATPPVATSTDSKTVVVKEVKPVKKEADSDKTVYESVRSGWNKFLDVLMGPATN